MIVVYKIIKVVAQVHAELLDTKSHICRTKGHIMKEPGDFVWKKKSSYIAGVELVGLAAQKLVRADKISNKVLCNMSVMDSRKEQV